MHAGPFEGEVQRDTRVVAAASKEVRGRGHEGAAEAEPDEGARDRGEHRVAPSFGRERADEGQSPQANGPQHAELRLSLVGQHDEDVHEKEDPRQDGERAEGCVQARQRLTTALRPIQHGLLAVVDARGDATEARCEQPIDHCGAARTGLDAPGVRHEHDRLRRRRVRRCAPGEDPGDRARADEHIVRRGLVSRPVPRETQLRQHPHHAQREPDPVRERVDRVAGLQLQRTSEVAADHGLTGAGSRTRHARRVRVAAETAGGREVGLEQLRLGRGAHRRRRRSGRCGGRGERERSVDVRVAQAGEPRLERRARREAVRGNDLVDRSQLFVRHAADRRVEGVTDHERAGHDRGSEQRTEDHERGLTGPAHGIAQRETAQHGLTREHEQERQRSERDDDHRRVSERARPTAPSRRLSRRRRRDRRSRSGRRAS